MGDVRRLSEHDGGEAERAVFLTEWLFARGHAADLVIAVMLAELAWLVGRGGWTPAAALLRLGPGVLMMLALRAALTGAGWMGVAVPLALAFPVHVLDLRRGSTVARESPSP